MRRFFTLFLLFELFTAGAQNETLVDLRLRVVGASSNPVMLMGTNLHVNAMVGNAGTVNLRSQDTLYFMVFIGATIAVDQSGQPVMAIANTNIIAGDSAAVGLDFYLPQGLLNNGLPLCLSMLTPTLTDTNTQNNTSCGNWTTGIPVGLAEEEVPARVVYTSQGPRFVANGTGGELRCYNLHGQLVYSKQVVPHETVDFSAGCKVPGVYVVHFESPAGSSAHRVWMGSQVQ